MILMVQTLHFRIDFSSKFHVFSGTPPGPEFSYFLSIFNKKIAGPSAQRRVGITCGWSLDPRVLLSIDPGDPFSPETSRRRRAEATLATLWRSKGRFLIDFWTTNFASIFESVFASIFE
jgi:hypothetical protein